MLFYLFIFTIFAACPTRAVSITCSTHSVPFYSIIGQYPVAGTLCVPNNNTGSYYNTVMLLVPGATYNQIYWDFTYLPNTYNFRLRMNNEGYSTFVVDRLGSGASSKPPGIEVTSILQANAIHVVVSALRTGISGISFDKVILGGHSLGSIIAIIEAGTYNDVDAVLLTGISHQLNASFTNLVANASPTLLDSQLSAEYGLNTGYITTEPNKRQLCFYSPTIPDPDVIALDERTKGVCALTEVTDGAVISVILPYSVLISVPVMIVVGKFDSIFCTTILCSDANSFYALEAPTYSSVPSLTVYLLEGAGHDVNLATTTQLYQLEVIEWLNTLQQSWINI